MGEAKRRRVRGELPDLMQVAPNRFVGTMDVPEPVLAAIETAALSGAPRFHPVGTVAFNTHESVADARKPLVIIVRKYRAYGDLLPKVRDWVDRGGSAYITFEHQDDYSRLSRAMLRRHMN